MANSIQYDYIITDRYSGPISKITRLTEKMRGVADKAARSVKNMGTKFAKASEKMSGMQGAITGLGAAAGISAIVSSTTKMQDAISDVGKVSNLTGEQLSGLRKDLEGLSERIGRPAAALAKIASEGKKLGTSDKDLMPFVETVSKMAVAFDMTEEAAGASIGSIKAKLGLSMDAVTKFGDSINHLANTTASGGENMINIIARTSGTMKMLKVPPEIIAGFASIGDQLEVSAELGASGINQMFNKMNAMPGMTKKLMSDPIMAVREVMQKFIALPEDQRPTAILKEFGPEAGRFIAKLVPNMKLFGETMNKAMSPDAIGSMQKEMDSYLSRASTRLKRAKERMTNDMNRFGEALVPIIEIIAGVAGGIGKMIGQFSEAHPRIAKLAAGTLVLVAVLTAVMAGVSMLIPVIGLLSVPVLAVVGAVVAVVGAFSYWIKTSNPLTQRLAAVFSSIGGLISAIGELFGVGDVGGKALSILAGAFDVLGTVISWALKPLLLMLTALTSIVKIASKLFSGDWSGAFDALKSGASGALDIITGADVTQNVEVGAAQAAKSSISQKAQNVNVGGTITVAAEKGSQVVSTTPDLDTGVNMIGL